LRPVFIVVAPVVASPICAATVVIGMHSPVASYCTMVPILTIGPIHISHSFRIILARAIRMVIVLMRSPIATDPGVVGALPVLLLGLIRLLRRKFRLYGGPRG